MVYVVPAPNLARGLIGRWSLNEQGGNVGSNLIANPGFETYPVTPGAPTSWNNNDGAATQLSQETTVTHSGSSALKITTDGTAGASPGVFQTILGLVAGHSYYAEAWARTDGSANSRPQFIIRNTTDAADVIMQTGTISGTTYERLGAATFRAVAGKTYVAICVNVGAPAGRVSYFDDVTVQEIVAADASPYANHATLSGATNTPGPTINTTGQVDTAYTFNGTDQYLDIGASPTLNISGPLSIFAWLKPTTIAAGTRTILDKFQTTTGYQLEQKAAAIQLVSDGPIANVSTGLTLVTTAFQLIGCTLDPAGALIFYYNGAATNTVASVTVTAPTTTGYIGAQNGSTQFLNGQADEIRVYNRALTPQEVLLLYQHGAAGIV